MMKMMLDTFKTWKEEEESMHNQAGIKKVVITSINGVAKFCTFRMRGVLQGKRVTILINGGASHNFINASLVNRRHLPIVEFEIFLVEVAGGGTMPCDRYIPKMSLTLGSYNLTHDFYVMDLQDTNVYLDFSGLTPWVLSPKTKKLWRFPSILKKERG
jgi:hypothetical protein